MRRLRSGRGLRGAAPVDVDRQAEDVSLFSFFGGGGEESGRDGGSADGLRFVVGFAVEEGVLQGDEVLGSGDGGEVDGETNLFAVFGDEGLEVLMVTLKAIFKVGDGEQSVGVVVDVHLRHLGDGGGGVLLEANDVLPGDDHAGVDGSGGGVRAEIG